MRVDRRPLATIHRRVRTMGHWASSRGRAIHAYHTITNDKLTCRHFSASPKILDGCMSQQFKEVQYVLYKTINAFMLYDTPGRIRHSHIYGLWIGLLSFQFTHFRNTVQTFAYVYRVAPWWHHQHYPFCLRLPFFLLQKTCYMSKSLKLQHLRWSYTHLLFFNITCVKD